jgi:hypothetical protein
MWTKPNFSAPKLFPSQLSAPSLLNLSLLRADQHRGVLKIAGEKESFSSSYKCALGKDTPSPVSPKD